MWPLQFCVFSASELIFSQSHLSIQRLIQLIYLNAIDMSNTMASSELEINKNTIIDWNNFCRDLCVAWNADNTEKIGGLDENFEQTTVEIDESCFFRRKAHRGRMGSHQWVFGGIQRQSRRCFMVPVADRSRTTLQPLIEKHGGGVFVHDVVVHERNFLNPNNPDINTQSVESLWKRAKKKLRNAGGTSNALFPSYISEVVWRENYARANEKEIFSSFIRLITDYYVL